MPEFVDFLPIFQETLASVRFRLDEDGNDGLVPTDAAYIDTREGAFFRDVTQPLAIEFTRLWDALSTEVPAACFPAYAWSEYLDGHAAIFDIQRKVGVRASGQALFAGAAGTVIPIGTGILTSGSITTEPLAYATTQVGLVSPLITAPTGLVATPSASGGTLVAGAHSYQITALTNPGETPPGTAASATTTGSTGSVALSWSAVTGAVAYRIYRLLGASYVLLDQVTSPAYVDTNAAPGDTSIVAPTLNTTGLQGLVNVSAVAIGGEYNLPVASLTDLETPVSGVTSVTNIAPLRGGADPEDDESLRVRLFAAFQPSGAGTISDYKRWALSRPGVAEVSVIPVWNGPGTVKVVVMGKGKAAVSAAVVNDVQTYLDPVLGKGHGRAPIGATVTTETVASFVVNVAATVKLGVDYSLDPALGKVTVYESIKKTVNDYLKSLDVAQTVVYNHIRGAPFGVTGVLDLPTFTINGVTADLTVPSSPIARAELGTFTLTEAP